MEEVTKAIHVRFLINTDQAEIIEELAWAHNCLCITHQPPDIDAWPAEIRLLPAQKESVSCVTFQENDSAISFQQALLQTHHLNSDLSVEEILPWIEYHRPYASPFSIGQLQIIPSPPPLEGPREPMTLYLPAGVGFGTGRHETTASCLELMQHINLESKKVIDFGCGSGILALACLTLGASHVWLHDHDAQALEAARQHLKNHFMSEKSTICYTSKELPQADILLANILFEILCELEELLRGLIPCGGLAIFSGVLDSQRDAFLEKFSQWELIEEKELEQWCSFILKKSTD